MYSTFMADERERSSLLPKKEIKAGEDGVKQKSGMGILVEVLRGLSTVGLEHISLLDLWLSLHSQKRHFLTG